MLNLFLVLIYVVGMVGGQVLFKIVAVKLKHETGVLSICGAMLSDPVFYAAIFLYGGLTVYWVWLLRHISISYAYPFVALSIAAVVVLGNRVWNEQISLLHACGIFLVLAGVTIIGIAGE